MNKLVAAIKRTLNGTDSQPAVHFHQGTHVALPEVCHERACGRPHLS